MTDILWLPGTLCDHRLFAAQRGVFGEHTTAQVGQFDSVTMQAHAAWQQVEASKVALVGLSYGGILALEMIRQHPERVSHLAILDSNARNDTGEKQRERNALVQRLFEDDFENIVMDQLKPLYLAKANQDNLDILSTVRDMAMDQGQAVLTRQIKAVRGRPDQRPNLALIRVPTLIMAGTEDILCPEDRQREMHESIPYSELVLLENCGHLATLEQPERVNEALEQLFKR